MAEPQIKASSSAQTGGQTTGKKRKSSVISMASNIDKENLTQALDTIHHTASRTQAFTAFNEYTVPPGPTSPKEAKGLTEDIQGSLSGLYTRLKETVGGKAGTRNAEEDDVPGDLNSRTLYSTPSQRASTGKKRNASPAPSQISITLDNRSGPRDSPSLQPLKTQSIAESALSSPVLLGEFRPSDNKLKSNLVNPGGAVSVASISQTHAGAVPVKQVNDLQKSADSKSIDAIEALRNASDGRVSRLKTDMDESAIGSEASSIYAPKDEQAQDVADIVNTAVHRPADRPVIAPPTGGAVNQVKQAAPLIGSQSKGQGRTNPQQRLHFLGLTRAISSASTTVASSSTSAANDEDEEALSSVGHLPPRPIKSNPTQTSTSMLAQLSHKLLGKEYWMRDENAKDCFYCGDAFSTFRRKHHCRICGQIFDSKCTSIVSGAPFGQSGTIRVCKPCEGIINGYDDSSEYSDTESIASGFRTRADSNAAPDLSPARSFTSLKAAKTETRRESIPTIAIPTRRLTEDAAKRRSMIMEIDTEPQRPSSARSLKPSPIQRSHGPGHRRMRSKTSLKLPSKLADVTAPFPTPEQQPGDENRPRLPTFHSDNVIDPDLAAYLSDDDSSENEQLSLAEAIHSNKPPEMVKAGLAALLAPSKKRSHLGDLNKDNDTASIHSGKIGRSRSVRTRNFSVSSNLNLRGSPRTHRYSIASQVVPFIHDNSPSIGYHKSSDLPFSLDGIGDFKNENALDTLNELGSASVEHVKEMLSQMLIDFHIPSKSAWVKALIPIILRSSHDVEQNVQGGDDIDVRHYIKLKKIAGGKPNDSTVYSGIVFTKNLALKSMNRSLLEPNVLILTFPIEYARHQRHFMSLEPVIRQEREYLQNLVHRIAALKPNLLLVEKGVSGLALEYLQQAGISTAYNVRRSVLEAVSRTCQTRIITSIDKLAIKPAHAGRCGAFYLKTFLSKGKKKTCMFLTGCPKALGCTIILRGSDEATLSKVKRITEFMVYVAYNLKLETAFMRDEFASIPTYPSKGTVLSDAEVTKGKVQIDSQSAFSTEGAKQALHAAEKSVQLHDHAHADEQELETTQGADIIDADEIKLPEDTPMPTFYSDMMERNRNTILSCSPCVKFMQPYLVVRAREQERRLMYLRTVRAQETEIHTEEQPSQFRLITPEMLQGTASDASAKVREVIRAVQDAQWDRAMHNYKTQKKQWQNYVDGGQDMFSIFTHQNITVLYSVVCASTSVPCRDPRVHSIRFYDENEEDETFDRDTPLGLYIESRCLEANSVCQEGVCDSKMLDHRHQYVHAEGQLSVTIEPHPPKLHGYQNIILMWSVCRVCGQETQTTPMSPNTWKYSWGKYLELSFWGHNLHPRANTCNHDLHKEHFRYFGFQSMAVRFQYDNIALLEIIVPRTRITWKVSNDLRFKNGVFLGAEERINKFMNSVKARLRGIRIETILPEKIDSFKEEITRLKELAQQDHVFLIEKLREKYMGSKYYEIIPFNRAIRAMEEKSVEWDNYFQDFDQNYFPSEKDIRRLATLQLKKMFLDRDDSTESLSLDEKTAGTSLTSSIMTEATTPDDTGSLVSPSKLSTREAHEMMSSVVEDQLSPRKMDNDAGFDIPPALNEARSSQSPSKTEEPVPDVEHLDLAVTPDVLVKTVSGQSDLTVGPQTPKPEPLSKQKSITEEPEQMSESAADTAPSTDAAQAEAETAAGTAATPRPGHENARRKSGFRSAIPLYRAQSQPNRREGGSSLSGASTPMPTSSASNATSKRLGFKRSSPEEPRHHERKTSDRFGIGAFKDSITRSMIPRSTMNRKKESKVSELAKHFEALSREFERERRRDKVRIGKFRQSRAFPSAAAAPIVEAFRDFQEAVDVERDSLTESQHSNEAYRPDAGMDVAKQLSAINMPDPPQQNGSGLQESPEDAGEETGDDTAAETETEEQQEEEHRGLIEDNGPTPIAELHKQVEVPSLDGEGSSLVEQEPTPSIADGSELDLKIDFPKHEKNSLMKLLTNFWAERSASGWSPLEYPLNPTDHVYADSDIIVREDEPSSLIAFVLGSDSYRDRLRVIEDHYADVKSPEHDKFMSDNLFPADDQAHIEKSLSQLTGTHFKYQFQEGSAKMLCKVFFMEQFEAVRRKCGISERYIETMSRCLKWDSKGGKTKSVFLKTLDDRLVLKSLSAVETQAFVKFAPSYFKLMSETLFHDLPSVIAKMVGFYQVVIKNPITGVEFNWFLLVMENLFYDRIPTRTFDLKGSMRNRRIQPTGEQNEVLLDENMVEYIFEKPLFAREHSKRLIAYSVFNDTLFLARQNVMDYSLMVAVDEDKKELVVGIIDCIRTYTWDKKLETWMKDRGKNRPTVTSPKEYKSRFRAAMDRYVLQAPTCWHQFNSRSRDSQDYGRPNRDDYEDDV